MARTPEDRHVGDIPLTELLSPALVLDRVPAAVSVWDTDMRCRFGNVRSAGLTRPHERHGPVAGATLSEWLPDQETYATYFAHAVAALDGRVEVFDAVFPAHDSLRHAHVRMDPVVAPSLQDASVSSAGEPIGLQILEVVRSDRGLQQSRLMAAEERGAHRAMLRLGVINQDLVRRLFAVTLQLSAAGQTGPGRGLDPAVGSAIDAIDGVIRDLRTVTVVN